MAEDSHGAGLSVQWLRKRNWTQAAAARGGQGLLAACNLRPRARVQKSSQTGVGR